MESLTPKFDFEVEVLLNVSVTPGDSAASGFITRARRIVAGWEKAKDVTLCSSSYRLQETDIAASANQERMSGPAISVRVLALELPNDLPPQVVMCALARSLIGDFHGKCALVRHDGAVYLLKREEPQVAAKARESATSG